MIKVMGRLPRNHLSPCPDRSVPSAGAGAFLSVSAYECGPFADDPASSRIDTSIATASVLRGRRII